MFRGDNPVIEIDNELKVFRNLFDNPNEERNYLIINQAGRISQHIVEYEARLKQRINHNIYNSSFEEFLDECEFIKGPLREYVLILRELTENNEVPAELGDESDEQLLSFSKSFHIFLFLYRNYQATRPDDTKYGSFRELHTTVKFLEKVIEKISNEGKYVSPQNDESKMDLAIQLIKEVKKDQNYHIGLSEDTNRKVGLILEKLEYLNNEFEDYRDLIEDSLKKELPEEEYEKIISKFSDKCVKKIRSSIEEDVLGSNDCKKMKEELIGTLGKSAWKKLSRQSKRFLITSKITFNSLHKLGDDIDYSGVCLLVTKALEVELTKRFYKGFNKYIEDNNIPLEKHHTSLVEEDDDENLQIVPDYKITLGSMRYILCHKKHYDPEIHEKNLSILTEYSKAKLFTDSHTDEEIKKTLRKYGKEIKNITYSYRNPAAHTDELQCRQAKKCLDYVIDVKHFLKTMLDSFDKENNR